MIRGGSNMKTRAFLLISAAVISPAHAQSTFELEDATVYSGFLPVDANSIGATVEILTDEALEDGGLSVDDTLERVPGLGVTRTGPAGANADIRLRGLPQRYTGVSIDGIQVNDPTAPTPSFNFGTMTRPLANRIEVAKGSQSTFNGSSAIGGAVNITTWRPEGEGLTFGTQMEVGSFETISSTISVGYQDAQGVAALTLSATDVGGYSARPANTENDGFSQSAMSAYLERDVTDQITLGFSAFYSDSQTDLDSSSSDPFGFGDEIRYGARAFAKITGDRVEHEVSASHFVVDRFSVTNFFGSASPFASEGSRTEVEYLGTTDLSATTSLAFGGEWVGESSETTFATRTESDSFAVYGEAQTQLSDRTEVSFALRHDVYSDFEDATTGRLALAHALTDTLTLNAVFATGFRAPSIFEQTGSTVPGPELGPETSRSFELGTTYTNGPFEVSALAFYNEVDDLIDYTITDFTTFDGFYANTEGTTQSKGIELQGEVDLGRIAVFGAYTYTDAETNGTRVLRVPRHDFVVGVSGDLSDRLSGTVSVRHVADRLDVDSSFATVAAPDYTVADVSFTYGMTEQVDAYLRVENIFDESYEEVLGFTSPGRSIYAGVRASF